MKIHFHTLTAEGRIDYRLYDIRDQIDVRLGQRFGLTVTDTTEPHEVFASADPVLELDVVGGDMSDVMVAAKATRAGRSVLQVQTRPGADGTVSIPRTLTITVFTEEGARLRIPEPVVSQQ